MTQNIERKIIEIIATDRIDIPISSMSGKLKRRKPKLAEAVNLSECKGEFQGERVEEDDVTLKARTMSEAVDQFAEEYPRYGQIVKGMIEETRAAKETNLYF